jgi:hypothetical protein
MILNETTADDVFDVAYRMRDQDFEEISLPYKTDDRKKIATILMDGLTGYYADGWTMCNDRGKRVAICGWSRYPEKLTRANVGFFATDEFNRMRYTITKTIRENLNHWAQQRDIVHMDCQSLEDYEQAHQWIEFFGFKRDNVLLNWRDTGRNYINFSKQILII